MSKLILFPDILSSSFLYSVLLSNIIPDLFLLLFPEFQKYLYLFSREKFNVVTLHICIYQVFQQIENIIYATESTFLKKTFISIVQFSSFQSLSRVRLFATPWTAAHQASLSITNSQSPPKPMSIELVMPSNCLILCCPLLLLSSIPPSIRVFSNKSALHMKWPKYWSFSFNISLSNENSGLISSRMDWLDLLAVQGTLKSLLQHHSSKVSIILCSAFFTVQLSHPYMTTGKTIAFTRWTFVGKVMSLLFNMLSRLVITFLLMSKHLLTSWLQSPSAVILEPKNKVSHCFYCFPICLPWSHGTGCHDLSFLNVEL